MRACGELMLVSMLAGMRAAATCSFAHARARLHRRVLVFINFERETQAARMIAKEKAAVQGRGLREIFTELRP